MNLSAAPGAQDTSTRDAVVAALLGPSRAKFPGGRDRDGGGDKAQTLSNGQVCDTIVSVSFDFPVVQRLLWPTLTALKELGGSAAYQDLDATVLANEHSTLISLMPF